MALDDLGLEVGHGAGRVCLYICFAVLYHYHTVLVIGIGNCKGVLIQTIEEGLLRIAVVLEGFVVVQMIACQIGEHTTCKLQAANTLLSDGMT